MLCWNGTTLALARLSCEVLHGRKRTLCAGVILGGPPIIPNHVRRHKDIRIWAPNFKGCRCMCLLGHRSHYTLHCSQTAVFFCFFLLPDLFFQTSVSENALAEKLTGWKETQQKQGQTPRIQIPKRCVMEWNLRITNEQDCFGDTSPQLETEM